MDENKLFEFETRMEPEDFRKSSYIAAFFQAPQTVPSILVMCAIGALLAGLRVERVGDILYMLMLWFTISVLVFTLLCFNVYLKGKRREAAARQTGALDRRMVMRFYDSYVNLENPAREMKRDYPYEQFWRLLESKHYFIFFLDKHQVTILRKKDIKNQDELASFSPFMSRSFGKGYRFVNL